MKLTTNLTLVTNYGLIVKKVIYCVVMMRKGKKIYNTVHLKSPQKKSRPVSGITF